MTFYPVVLDVRGRRCVVIGGGPVAEQKVAGLLDAGAAVTVISPLVTPRLDAMAAKGEIALQRRAYHAGDLAGAFAAIAAAEDRSENQAIYEEAEREGVLLNAVDDIEHCHFIAPAVFRQGDVVVTISTAGKSPALAVRLRERLGALVGPEYATFLDLLGEVRPEVSARVPDLPARAALWYRIVDSDAIEFVRRGDLPGARRRIRELIDAHDASRARRNGPRSRPGIVYLVGAGPGDPGLITVRGLEVLRRAEVVVYDRLVSAALLDEAPPRAERIFAGKTAGRHHMPQDEMNALLIQHARAGRTVVRLKGGDPFVFGRGGEECEALRAAGIPFVVVPGLTAAVAVPAFAGIPVTHRRYASAFGVVTGHECDGGSDLDWAALARLPALVVLMGLRRLADTTQRLIAHGADSATPAAVVASGSLPQQRTVSGTLKTIAGLVADAGLEPPATLIVGEVVRLREAIAWFEGELTPSPALKARESVGQGARVPRA